MRWDRYAWIDLLRPEPEGGHGGEGVPIRVICKGRLSRQAEAVATPITWEERPSLLIFLKDITEKRYAEEARNEMEEEYRDLQ